MRRHPGTFNKIFDHTILKPAATAQALEAAVAGGFCAVAVNTAHELPATLAQIEL